MSSHPNVHKADFDEHNLPIEIYFGSPSLDLGMAALPRILPRFWVHLAWEGEQLADWEYAVLIQVLTLREAQDYELRAANLPLRSKPSSIERVKAKLRRMGLVFTQRLYYPLQPGQLPRMYAQRWDLRSLFYNLELIARQWRIQQTQLVDDWNAGGRNGPRPVFNFDPGFVHTVQLPPDVAVDVLRGVFFPTPDHWQQQARDLIPALPTAQEMRGTVPTAHEMRGTPTTHEMRGSGPTAHQMRGHLLEDEEEEEEGNPPAAEAGILAHFAARRGDPAYQPTAKERAALQKLLAEGFSPEQVIAGIDAAFARPSKPRYFTHCAAVAHDLARRQQELQSPETRTQPEARTSEALTPVESSPDAERSPQLPASALPLLIDAHLARAAEVYRSSDRDLNSDLLARLRLMAARGDQAARAAQSTGGDWLADALSTALGVARPGNLLNYADAVLGDWIQNGRPGRQRPARPNSKPRARKRDEPGTHQGIRDYLEKHGGIPNDPTDSHSD